MSGSVGSFRAARTVKKCAVVCEGERVDVEREGKGNGASVHMIDETSEIEPPAALTSLVTYYMQCTQEKHTRSSPNTQNPGLQRNKVPYEVYMNAFSSPPVNHQLDRRTVTQYNQPCPTPQRPKVKPTPNFPDLIAISLRILLEMHKASGSSFRVRLLDRLQSTLLSRERSSTTACQRPRNRHVVIPIPPQSCSPPSTLLLQQAPALKHHFSSTPLPLRAQSSTLREPRRR